MEHIGHAAWRVLQNARKAAIARKEIEEAERRGPALFEVEGIAPATRQRAATPTVGDRAELERTRKKRPTGL
ncbi:hypothetical protein ACLBWS_05835 [Brucellaceae bacterium D45D]